MNTAQRTITQIMPIGITATEAESKKIRIAAYCRVSSDSSDQEQSFAAQVRYYTQAISQMTGAELVDIYADEAISGRGTEKREDFNRLIADCKKGKIDRILTKSVSRFARNTVDCLHTVRMLSELGVSVMFEKEHIDTATMTSEVLLAMSGTQAQDESISHGNNMRWSYERRMKDGNFLGCKSPYGYDLQGCAMLVINEKEAEIVLLIGNLYLSGMGKQRIADYLNDNGIEYRNGRKWTAFIIHYILNNERYVGDALLQKKITTKEYPPRKIHNDGSVAQYYVQNSHPAIMPREMREAILALQAQRRGEVIKTGGHALSKMLRCADCGHAYRRVKTKKQIVWKCAYQVAGRSDCTAIAVREDDVCQAMIDVINKLHDSREALLIPLIARMEEMQSKVNGTEIKIYEVDSEIAVLSKQSLVVAELLSSGILDPSDFTAQNNELNNKISELRRKRRELLKQNENDDQLAELRELCDMLEAMDGEMTEYDEDTIRSIIRHATVLSSTEIRIHLHGGLEVTERLPQYYNRRCKHA